MAEKRMFAKSIVLSDAFLDMPMSARCLYFTLGMLADDDGFVGGPKSIMRQCGASQDDLMILLSKRYILAFESGVIVIKHWRINNYLQNDRIVPTTYQEELKTLTLDEKKSYVEIDKKPCIQNVYTVENSIEEKRVEESSRGLSIPSGIDRSTADAVEQVVTAWNSYTDLKPITKVVPGKQRDTLLRARIREYGLEKILEAIDIIPKCPFLMGDNKNGWTITFDWFIKPNNFPKVLEGNYLEGSKKTTSNPFRRISVEDW